MPGKLTCPGAHKLIRPYLDDELSARDCVLFIAHIRECEACRYELETSFIVEYALKYLDEDKMESFDIKGLLDEHLDRSEKRMARRRVLSMVIWGAIVFMAVLIAILLMTFIIPDFLGILYDFLRKAGQYFVPQ